jgi:tRNA(fMet)-specific endonuclease VapC
MNYLLDTNACITLINGSSDPLRKRFSRSVSAGDQLFVSSVAMFELWYGIFKSSRPQFNTERLEAFLEGPIALLSFDEDDARTAGSVHAALKQRGKPIGSYDVLLAGQAINRKLTLVTANTSEFSRVKKLVWQDWSKGAYA